ncbi:MAG: endonuclease MutS2 [Deltaproteobacteria bacterium]|nr:endonuclease MutS2 [Deltaproteobacteria bacterium]
MGFKVSQSTLESLEWTRVVDELRAGCRTPQAHQQLGGAAGNEIFEQQEAGVRRRLQETSEARALIDAETLPPFAGCRDLEASLSLADKGGVLESAALIDIRTTLEAVHETRHYFERRRDECPSLGELAADIVAIPDLQAQIARCLDASGEVRDAASATLATARRDTHRLATDLKNRIEQALGHADIAPHLSDHYYTIRNGRFVLPVKSNARSKLRGIVHDASRSGTTLFIEPDDMVELNNRHRQAELTVEREILRVLRELSVHAARESVTLRSNLESLASLDLAFARGRLSKLLDATPPRVEKAGIFELPSLRHPLIPADECVANDLRLGLDSSVLILSGPNAGGKTVALKSIALAALFVRAGLHVAAGPGARVDLVDHVFADIGDHQDIRESLSTFSAAMANLARILREADENSLVCLDEVGVGTDPSEGAAIAQATLEALADCGARSVTTTHYNLLKEMAEVDDRFQNASVEFDPETLAPTYRVHIGAPGASSATTVAARMGMPQGVLDRASALLDREDRRLDRMLAQLATSRAALETEKMAAQTLRLEGEKAREQYRAKLARLQERRDKLFGEMRRELDDSFRDAHAEVARIIREMQRKPSSQTAAGARAKLETLREITQREQREQGLTPEPVADSPAATPIDWPRARVGDAVGTPGGVTGKLLSLPDRKGRVMVQVTGAKLTLSRDRLSASPRPAPEDRESDRTTHRQRTATPPLGLGGVLETDLRGLRVDEALESLEKALERAVAEGRAELRVIHGIGTGALREAVREQLPRSPYVLESLEAASEEGGAGATRAILRKD